MSYAERQTSANQAPRPQPDTAVFDPLRFCIFTTIALIAWAVGPALAVALMSGIGLWAYARAWRQGLRRSDCFLRDPRLIMGYLGAAFVAGVAVTLNTMLQIVP